MGEKNESNEFKELISKLEKSSEFKEQKKQSPDMFLAHVFVMFDDANKDLYQLGYYVKKTQNIITFIVKFEDGKIKSIETVQGSDILRTGAEIKKLDLEKVKLSSKKVFEIAENLKKEKYSSEPVSKAFLILQNLDDKQVFNFTFMTASFKTINIKILSDEGAIVGSSLKNLINILK